MVSISIASSDTEPAYGRPSTLILDGWNIYPVTSNLAQTMLGFRHVSLKILNHLRAKLFRDLLSRDGPRPLRADLGAHSHVHTTQRRGLH